VRRRPGTARLCRSDRSDRPDRPDRRGRARAGCGPANAARRGRRAGARRRRSWANSGRLKAKEILRSGGAADREQGEIPFVDAENKLYAATGTDGDILRTLPSVSALRSDRTPQRRRKSDDWVVVARVIRLGAPLRYRASISGDEGAEKRDGVQLRPASSSSGIATVGMIRSPAAW
jgi:hypothetical protein